MVVGKLDNYWSWTWSNFISLFYSCFANWSRRWDLSITSCVRIRSELLLQTSEIALFLKSNNFFYYTVPFHLDFSPGGRGELVGFYDGGDNVHIWGLKFWGLKKIFGVWDWWQVNIFGVWDFEGWEKEDFCKWVGISWEKSVPKHYCQ